MKEYIVAFTDDADMGRLEMLHGTNGELIRCKDCKHHHYDSHEIPYCDKRDYGYGWEDDDFCSKAERKENDTVD